MQEESFDFYFSAQQARQDAELARIDFPPYEAPFSPYAPLFIQGKRYTLCVPQGVIPQCTWPDLELVHTGPYVSVSVNLYDVNRPRFSLKTCSY